MGLIAQSVTLIILLVLSGFFSGAEVALISLSDSKVRHLVKAKKRGAIYIKRLKDNPQRMLSTVLIGNNIVNVAAASMMTVVAIGLFENYAVGIATGVMTILILVFGEITPKSIAAQNSIFFSQAVSPLIWWLSLVLSPILKVLDLIISGIFKLFGIKAQSVMITEEEIRSMVAAAEEEGSIKEIEGKLIHNIFEFDETTAGEIQTPRTDVVAISATAIVQDAIELINKRKHSRIPVYEGQKDNIVGIIYIKDLIAHLERGRKRTSIRKVMKKPYFVPEHKMISDLLRKFQTRKEHMAIVVDEHGLVTGIVTLEDVLEEIVGEIIDEAEKVDPSIKKLNENTWLIKGKTHIDDVNAKVPAHFPHGEYDTLSGFILNRIGKIPEEGEEIPYGRHVFTIDERKGNRIVKVRLTKIKEKRK